VDLLLAHNADVNEPLGNDGASCIVTAARAGKSRILRHLLGVEGADIEKADADNTTPLQAAAANGHHNCVSALLRAGANVNSRDDYGWSPLLAACYACAKTLTLTDTSHVGRKRVKPFRSLVLLLASKQLDPMTMVQATTALRALRHQLAEEDDNTDDDCGEGGEARGGGGAGTCSGWEGGIGGREDVPTLLLKGMLFSLPILEAECSGERRWCAYPPCHEVDRKQHMDLCTGCQRVGYCSLQCQKAHWKEKAPKQGWVRHKLVCRASSGGSERLLLMGRAEDHA
jgi:hypothetical protein